MPQTRTSTDSNDRHAILMDVLATALLELLANPGPPVCQIQQTSRSQRNGPAKEVSVC